MTGIKEVASSGVIGGLSIQSECKLSDLIGLNQNSVVTRKGLDGMDELNYSSSCIATRSGISEEFSPCIQRDGLAHLWHRKDIR